MWLCSTAVRVEIEYSRIDRRRGSIVLAADRALPVMQYIEVGLLYKLLEQPLYEAHPNCDLVVGPGKVLSHFTAPAAMYVWKFVSNDTLLINIECITRSRSHAQCSKDPARSLAPTRKLDRGPLRVVASFGCFNRNEIQEHVERWNAGDQ